MSMDCDHDSSIPSLSVDVILQPPISRAYNFVPLRKDPVAYILTFGRM